MFRALQILSHLPFADEVVRPATRAAFGWLVTPVCRFIRSMPGLRNLSYETVHDIQQWLHGSLLLLIATKNVESLLFGDVMQNLTEQERLLTLIPRFLLAIGVIETMPDQDVFGLIHTPPKLQFDPDQSRVPQIRQQIGPYLRGLICLHLNRTSCMFAIIATIATGWIGWTAFAIALIQYLIIGLITSRSQARIALDRFDEMVARRRAEFLEEFDLTPNTNGSDV